MTTSGEFRYMDPASISAGTKPWSKVDGAYFSFTLTPHRRSVANLRDHLAPDAEPGTFGSDIDVSGFATYHFPAAEKTFSDDAAVRTGYYDEVKDLLRSKLQGSISHIEIFDHTIRRRDPTSPRQPVQQVHVDQTPAAAEARVRRHVKLPPPELDALLQCRYQIINVWRPIGHPATDFPLAVIDWRSTKPDDLVPVDLLYPLHHRGTTSGDDDDDDDRGKETLPDLTRAASTEGYGVKGETYGVLPSEAHRLYYVKDMTPDEVLLLKCFDSWAEGKPQGREGVAAWSPHTAFVDPATPEGTKGRESIEVRCLVFYDE
ncbi:hypothetical protein N658DRAFT_501098 [Parathielavia hyrcaniae]|uniref:Methyltransferase n=1 Tax=Parathielavia hyrcaniae TaxID=113614 RepID=A0AAN6SXW6_9PEZI|nr:hypothetical protein N658DRAFT_501098 [Parathielavia hyrcaniae]